jgi:hypothetical protein
MMMYVGHAQKSKFSSVRKSESGQKFPEMTTTKERCNVSRATDVDLLRMSAESLNNMF